jgi:hypothetical protein
VTAEQPGPGLPDSSDEIVRRAAERQRLWQRQQRIWNVLHYGLNVSAIGLTLATAALPSMVGTDHKVLFPSLSLIAALLVALVAFSTPSKQARSYIAAWRVLDEALLQHERARSPDSLDGVLKAIREGEEILSGKDPY